MRSDVAADHTANGSRIMSENDTMTATFSNIHAANDCKLSQDVAKSALDTDEVQL